MTADRLTKGIAALRSLSSDQKIKRALDKIRGSIDLLVLHEVVSVHNISRYVLDSIKTLVASATVPQGVNRNTIALLHQACRLGLRQSMRVIINMGVPVDSRDDFDRTPLHTAVINKQTDIVRLLCDNFFAPIDTPDQSGRTPLHLAILNDYIDIAWLLRQRRARLDIFDDYGETPLDMIRGDFLTKWRINRGMLVDAKDPVTGNTAIIQASHQGNLNAVERLVVEKADINALNARRSTALAEACQEGHIAIVSSSSPGWGGSKCYRHIQPLGFDPLHTHGPT